MRRRRRRSHVVDDRERVRGPCATGRQQVSNSFCVRQHGRVGQAPAVAGGLVGQKTLDVLWRFLLY